MGKKTSWPSRRSLMMEKYFWTLLTLVIIVQFGKRIKNSPLILNKLLAWIFTLLLVQLFIVNIFCFLILDSSFIDILMFIQFVFYFFAILGIFSEFKGVLGRIIFIPTSFLIVNAVNLKALYFTLTTGFNSVWETKVH